MKTEQGYVMTEDRLRLFYKKTGRGPAILIPNGLYLFDDFSHLADHRALIAALDPLIAPGGKIVFAAEPIVEEFPLPWGLRLDGESLLAIRRHGWLELGFKESYFRKLLSEHSWTARKEMTNASPWGTLFAAQRKS